MFRCQETEQTRKSGFDTEIEWLKVRPCFFTEDGGQLAKKKVWYDCEKEFTEILKKYSIPSELQNGVYTIYGYK